MRSVVIAAVGILLLFSSCSVVKTAADLQRIANSGTKRVTIKNDIDLQGQSLRFPVGCKLVFRGGAISNGHLSFDAVVIKGCPKFRNCYYQGTIRVEKIDDRNYTSQDDDGTLKFLLTNAIENGARCKFFRDYKIDMNALSGSGLVSLRDIESGADITFQGNAILNTKVFTKPTTKPFIVLTNVNGVTIRDCRFRDVAEHNTRNFKNSTGCTFIHCYGDCEAINLIDCSQENGDCILRSGVYTHNKSHPERTPTVGLSNSVLKVSAKNTGYGLALYCGDNLDIDLTVESPHRGFYCTGVSNSKINYNGHNPIETKCHILIKDAVFRHFDESGNEVLDMKGCHDLVIKANIEEMMAGESVVIFQSYGSGRKEGADFTFRSGKCHHYNVDITANIGRGPAKDSYSICTCNSDSGALNEEDMYGCKVSNITIHDVNCGSGTTSPYMCNFGPFIEADIDVRDCILTSTDSSRKPSFNYRVLGNTSGMIRVTNSMVGNVVVRKKTSGNLDIVVDNEPAKLEPNYSNDNSVRGLVRVMKRTN